MDDNKKQALNAALDQITKQFGKGAVVKLGDSVADYNVEAIPTGSLGLDIALGIGGFPKGRVVEIYGCESSGKTTLSLHALAEVQKAGGVAGFIDAEHALDPVYAKNLGVDIDELYISQPDSGEQALEICETMVRSGAIDCIVIDSVAALVPKVEIDGEMGDSHVGLQARLMSQALRKLTSAISDSGCLVIFINQLREKVGVMFGCLHADTVIPFTDGRAFPIREIVEKRIPGKVWSYNEKTKQFEEKDIIDWHYNGDVDDNSDYIHIETGILDAKNGVAGITVTPNHQIMTEKGWKEAKDLTLQDSILSKYHSVISDSLKDFLYGMRCGDSHLAVRHTNTASLRIQDSSNEAYLHWKLDKLKPFYNFSWIVSNGHKQYQSEYTSELAVLKRITNGRNPIPMLKYNYSDLSMAIWYMDDGSLSTDNSHRRVTISVKRFKKDHYVLNQIVDILNSKGMDCSFGLNDGTIRFKVKGTQELMKRIARYVPECMQYKLLPEFRNKYEEFELSSKEFWQDIYVPIKMIRQASDRQMRQRGKYDLSIEDNHNYLAGSADNGLLVHNSPETTTGGRALKFYSSVRIDIRRKDKVMANGEIVGNHVLAKVVKNKVAPPFREAEFDIIFGKGINHTAELLDMAASAGIIDKAGAWYSYGSEKIGQGRNGAVGYLNNNPDILAEIEGKVREYYIGSRGKPEDDSGNNEE